MSALAKILIKCGKKVGGCDRSESDFTKELSALGVDITIGDGNAEDYEVVVYTDAIADNNQTILKARRQGKTLIARGQLLCEVSKLFKHTVAVAGCHGKTTATSMIAHIFGAAKKNFSAHIGGDDCTFSNAYMGGYDYFITEACEYKKNFLLLKPEVAVVLNSEADHMDCYGSLKNLKAAYAQFAANSENVIKLYGDVEGADGITFGFDDRATYYAKKIRNVRGKFFFTAYEGDYELGKVYLSTYGKHNVLNALAAIAVARHYGIEFESIAEGLNKFVGVKRRFENIGSFNGAVCIADYAHHPTEIRATLKTARLTCDGELFVVFQPHTYSRTKTFFKQFASVLSPLKRVMIYKTYAAREYYDDAGSALNLSKKVKRSIYGESEGDISYFLKDVRKGDVVLFLGAGDIYDIAKTVTDN